MNLRRCSQVLVGVGCERDEQLEPAPIPNNSQDFAQQRTI